MNNKATNSRLSALETHVLLVLAEGDLHGYGIAKAIEQRDGPKIYPANLYRHLNAMAARGLIESAGSRVDAAGRLRKQFRVCAGGLEAVRSEGRRLRILLDEIEHKNLLAPDTASK